MVEQLDEQVSTFTRQFATAASRANRMALENCESVFGMHLKTFEKNVQATSAFFGELASASGADGYRTLWPKGLQVARDNAQRSALATHEVVGMTLKTQEALGQLAKSQIEAATDRAQGASRSGRKGTKAA